ncbi:MAG TPA: extensin family protein [Hyphomicrobiaceae bacterium]|nr:extensin family protein [Hyphomicrobiaceae bacterium]
MRLALEVQRLISRSVVSVSTKLSAAAVLGMATLPVLPHDAASWMSTSAGDAPRAPVELIHARPVPLLEAPAADPEFQLVARRTRARREPRPPEPGDEPPPKTPAVTPAPQPAAAEARRDEAGTRTGKVSAITPPEPPAPPAKLEPEATPAEPPKPDVWSDAEVIAALRECVKVLAPIAADIDIAEPVKREQCGAPAPVLLKRIGSGANKVELNPPALVNCAMVASLHTWVERTLQPAAQEAFGSPIARLRNASGYACRNRIGSATHTDRLSEHALANAVDIAGFVTADGRAIEVGRFWGPTARDEREAERTAAAQARNAPAPAETSRPTRVSDRKISAIASAAAAEPARDKKGATTARTAELQKPGKTKSDAGADSHAIPAAPSGQGEDVRKTAEAHFLRRLHKGACGVFGTVLGPEANEAHRDHFHFDLAHRRHSALCQ